MSNMLKNWKVVVISLIGATTFWFFNALNKNYDANIDYPVEFVFSRDSNVVMQPLPSSIRINVSSGGWNLLRKTFWFNVPPIKIPLEQASSTWFIDRGQLFPIVVNQMSELKVNHIVNDSLFLFIEQKTSKKVALKIDSTRIPVNPNYRITSSINITPDSIQLVGPSSFIDTLKNDYLLTLNMEDIDESVNQNILVNLPNKQIESEPKEINISFDLEEYFEEEIEVKVELAGFPPDSSKYIENGLVTVKYVVSNTNRRTFNASEFVVLADFSTLDVKDSTVVPILLFYPVGIEEPEVIPEELKVVYE